EPARGDPADHGAQLRARGVADEPKPHVVEGLAGRRPGVRPGPFGAGDFDRHGRRERRRRRRRGRGRRRDRWPGGPLLVRRQPDGLRGRRHRGGLDGAAVRRGPLRDGPVVRRGGRQTYDFRGEPSFRERGPHLEPVGEGRGPGRSRLEVRGDLGWNGRGFEGLRFDSRRQRGRATPRTLVRFPQRLSGRGLERHGELELDALRGEPRWRRDACVRRRGARREPARGDPADDRIELRAGGVADERQPDVVEGLAGRGAGVRPG
ncbi:uncharacterized protein METZ01_LOCUS438843, partial [marine metagenome]